MRMVSNVIPGQKDICVRWQFLSKAQENLWTSFPDSLRGVFLSILSKRHHTKKVKANVVYNEFIQDKMHIHMNATYWGTLTSFVNYLGREGKCEVEETEKGWYIQWIDNDPKTLEKRARGEKKRKHDQDDEDRHQRLIEKQIAASKAQALARGIDTEEKFTDLKEDPSKLSINLSISAPVRKKQVNLLKSNHDNKIISTNVEKKRKRFNAAESIVNRMESKKRSEPELVDGCWLQKGIVVKLKDKSFGEFRKKKAVVTYVSRSKVGSGKVRLVDRKKGKLEDFDISINQRLVETVVPKLGGTVAIVSKKSGFENRGNKGKLIDVNLDKSTVSVKILEGTNKGKTLADLEYDNISKLYFPQG
mmetsp:Transcript_2849/g.3841  ORF Transcript_2849/g.3841 Transcript_2849/m.3841 type:complete len:361 (+) Transcript_2849:318-1400(+)